MKPSHRQATMEFVRRYYCEDEAESAAPESAWARSWLKFVRGGRVLSIGCGPNLYNDAAHFGEMPEQIVGVDYNMSNIEFLQNSLLAKDSRDYILSKGVSVQLLSDDIRNPRNDFVGRFDSVYAGAVLGMFEESDLDGVVKLLFSYLRPGGQLLDIDWTDCKLSNDLYAERASFGWYNAEGPDIQRIGELIKAAGFSIEKHGRYSVADSQTYGWGTIYGFLALRADQT